MIPFPAGVQYTAYPLLFPPTPVAPPPLLLNVTRASRGRAIRGVPVIICTHPRRTAATTTKRNARAPDGLESEFSRLVYASICMRGVCDAARLVAPFEARSEVVMRNAEAQLYRQSLQHYWTTPKMW